MSDSADKPSPADKPASSDNSLHDLAEQLNPSYTDRIRHIDRKIVGLQDRTGLLTKARSIGFGFGLLTLIPPISRRYAIIPLCVGLTAQRYIMKHEDHIELLEMQREDILDAHYARQRHLVHQVLTDLSPEERSQLTGSDIAELIFGEEGPPASFLASLPSRKPLPRETETKEKEEEEERVQEE